MLSKTLRISTLIFLLFGVLSFFTSCASMTKKFKGGTKENISIFADQTIAMLSEEDLGFSRSQTIYVREFYDVDGEEEQKFVKFKEEAAIFFTAIIRYSFQLVTIAETEESEQGRIDAYAKFISYWDDDVLERLNLEPDYYAEVIDDVRTKETFLGALQTAQPLINAAGRWMNQVLNDLNTAADALAIKIDGMIDDEFREVIIYQEALENEKYAILRSFGKIYSIYKGDSEAYRELLDLGTIRRKELITEATPAEDELGKLAGHLLNQLDALHKIENEIKLDWENYRASHRELDEIHLRTLNRINRARVITLVWLRAHQKMASGIATSAEWFDISTLPSELFRLGTKAIF